MRGYHWGIIAVLLIGYLIGVYFPGPGARLKAGVAQAVGA